MLYNDLVARLAHKAGSKPIDYPDRAPADGKSLIDARREYWTWFDKNFSPTTAMTVVEEAACKHKRIRWIDYRVPLGVVGSTLHLHIVPAGE